MSTEPANRPRAERAVKRLYGSFGWRPPTVVWADCPLTGFILFHLLARIRSTPFTPEGALSAMQEGPEREFVVASLAKAWAAANTRLQEWVDGQRVEEQTEGAEDRAGELHGLPLAIQTAATEAVPDDEKFVRIDPACAILQWPEQEVPGRSHWGMVMDFRRAIDALGLPWECGYCHVVRREIGRLLGHWLMRRGFGDNYIRQVECDLLNYGRLVATLAEVPLQTGLDDQFTWLFDPIPLSHGRADVFWLGYYHAARQIGLYEWFSELGGRGTWTLPSSPGRAASCSDAGSS